MITLTQHSLPPAPILKWTCDEMGNWRQVPMILAKTEQGWSDKPCPHSSPSLHSSPTQLATRK